MRVPMVLLLFSIPLIAWGVSASGEHTLTLIPTSIEELTELRLATGEKAVLNDGTLSAVYDRKVPSEGNVFLNLHVDIATEGGAHVLFAKDNRLVKGGR